MDQPIKWPESVILPYMLCAMSSNLYARMSSPPRPDQPLCYVQPVETAMQFLQTEVWGK